MTKEEARLTLQENFGLLSFQYPGRITEALKVAIEALSQPSLPSNLDEPELTPLEDLLSTYLKGDFEYFSTKKWDEKKWNEVMRIQAAELLSIARKQLQPEIDAEIEKAYKTADEVQYRKGREEALRDLPKWKPSNCPLSNLPSLYLTGDGAALYKDGYEISISGLEKLPKEETNL